VTYSALIPEIGEAGLGPYPVLYLLHPSGGDHADWLVKTSLERQVKGLPLVVILPSLDHSLGCNMATGEEYERFFVDDLMAHVENSYSVKSGPENTAVAGAGSGGYAALRMALMFPYWFGTAAAHSPEVYATQEVRTSEILGGSNAVSRYRRVFGDQGDARRTSNDLLSLAESLDARQSPALYFDCGQKDLLLAHNREWRKRLQSLRIPHEWVEFEGDHDWDSWDQRLPASLDFIAKSLGI
jgi:S-formylglutathione hydrolase FrmB